MFEDSNSSNSVAGTEATSKIRILRSSNANQPIHSTLSEKELAEKVARSQTGEVVVYPVVETEQIDQVCRRVIAPARLAESVTNEVRAIATDLVNSLGVVGIFGIELFLTQSGQVLVNEIAPRTHNSGHYTLDACATSQFEQQLRAVSGLPLGDSKLTAPGAVMINLLGTENADSGSGNKQADKLNRLKTLPDTYVYWYGKKQSRVGRKMAHVTVLTDSSNDDRAVADIVQRIESIWYET